MMAALLSTGQASAQETGVEKPPEKGTEAPMSELEKLKLETEQAGTMEEEPGVEDAEVLEEPGYERPVSGVRPPSATSAPTVGQAGMGTEAAERERMRRSVGTVGESVREKGEDIIPLKFIFHGFYRTRYHWIGNAPMPVGSIPSESDFPSKNASFGTMRLRLDPEVAYGPNPDLPIARLRFTIDGLDNVVWGDNARVFSTPLFAVDQSKTTIDGVDLTESLKLERAWIEFLVPIGQIRVGRMESHWGVGTLTHAGNGLAEWGDFYRGETFDRVIFATRPITLGRGIASGDTRETPLIYAFVYDRISQDPVVDSTITSPFDGRGPAAVDPNFKPFYTTFDERSVFPLAYLTNLDERVSEIVNVLAWHDDEDFGRSATDEIFAGAYVVYRFQRATESRITIPDVSWRLKYTLKNRSNLAVTTEGEYHAILGHSGALAFTNNALGATTRCPPQPCYRGEGKVHNLLARIGVMDEGEWKWQLEGGYATGDDNVLSLGEGPPVLKTRGFNENIKVGLLMYQVALKALTFQPLNPLGAADLGANGSVWNSKYFLPSYRFTIVPGLEVHAQFLIGWADKLDPVIYANKDASCGFTKECFYGWEADLALRAKMGDKDIVWVDLESGMMQPGKAFTNAGFNDAWLWTVQIRASMIF
jgi:hypothetical protein